jgi:hypothetical protein
LTNLHDDMAAVLNTQVTALGTLVNEGTAVTQALLDQIIARFAPIAGAPGQATNYLILVLDPVGIDLDAGTQGGRAQYSLQSANSLQATASNGIARSYWDVGGNVEVMVLAGALGNYSLNLSDVAAGSRGAVVIFANGTLTSASLTDAIRKGQDSFDFFVPAAAVAAATLGQQPAGGTSVATATISASGAGASSFFFAGLPEPGTYGVGDQLAVSLLLTLVELGGGSILTTGVGYEGGTSVAPSGVGEIEPGAPNNDANPNPNPIPDANPNANPPNPNQNLPPNPNPNRPPNLDQNVEDARPPAETGELTLEGVTSLFKALVGGGDAPLEISLDSAAASGADELDPCLAAAVFTAGLCQSWLENHRETESISSKSRWKKEWLQPQV